MGDAILVVYGIEKRETAHAETSLLHRAIRIAFDLLYSSILHIEEHSTSLVAARSRPLGIPVNGVLTLLPHMLFRVYRRVEIISEINRNIRVIVVWHRQSLSLRKRFPSNCIKTVSMVLFQSEIDGASVDDFHVVVDACSFGQPRTVVLE